MTRQNSRSTIINSIFAIAAAALIVWAASAFFSKVSSPTVASPQPGVSAGTTVKTDGELTVTFIDVGQGDSILIKTPAGKYVLVDAGTNSSTDSLIKYLNDNTGGRLDAVVGTHPHEDHIGGMDAVIKKFDIGDIYMPKVSATTKTFEDVLIAIKNKGKTVKTAKTGVTIDVDPAVAITMLSPGKASYDETNDYSPVIRLVYGKTAYVLEADAETVVEDEILASGANIKADVLKVGHHGSNSSSSPEFLQAVGAKYAVISVGADNSFGHPTARTLERLQAAGAKIYRTDQSGTIVTKSDGESVSVLTASGTGGG